MKQKTEFKRTEMGVIPINWEIKKIGKITEQIFSGGTPDTRKQEYWDDDIPWLSSGETGNRFIRNTEKKITKLGVDNSSTKLAKIGDVVVATAGQGHTRGQTSFCMMDTYINQSIVALRTKKEELDPLFLFYNLLSRYTELRNISDAHSSRGSLTTKLLAGLNIRTPPIYEQKNISNILFSIDSKIELAQEMNKTLESMCRIIFKHWFIDFEFPNEKGKPYKSSGGIMVYNEELENNVPDGWKASSVDKEFNLVMGQSPPGSSYNEAGKGVVFFQGRTDFGHRFPSIRMYCTKPTRFAKKDDTLISVRAPVGDINLALQDCCIGRGLAAIRHKSNHSSYTYYFMMTLRSTFDHFESEGTVFGSIGKTDFKKIRVIAPDKKIVNLFQDVLESIDKKIEDNTMQIMTLSNIRDSLIPKLMSGKIRVPIEAT